MTYEVLRPLSDWHEDDGDVLWYRVPIHEPPFVSSPLSSDWLIETSDGRCVKVDDDEEDEDPKPWATHWHPLPRVIFESDEIKRLRADAAEDLASVVTEEDKLMAELAGLSTGVSTEDNAMVSLATHRMEQILQRLLEIEQAGALAIDREHERRMQDLDSTMEGLGLATRVEAKRLDEAQEEIAALRAQVFAAVDDYAHGRLLLFELCDRIGAPYPSDKKVVSLTARVKELEAENAALREACTLALGVMEQKNRVTVLPTAKFVDVKFDQEDIAVLRAALEKKP